MNATTKTTPLKPKTHIARCRCGSVFSCVTVARVDTFNGRWINMVQTDTGAMLPSTNAFPDALKCQCGAMAQFKVVKGSVSDAPCNDKCVSSKGHCCDCACGGRNHGRGYSVAA